jgi:hypothetical protein
MGSTLREKKMNIDHLIQSIEETCHKFYDKNDPMRWCYQVGMLQSKLREMGWLINAQADQISQLEKALEEKDGEL